MQISQYNDQDQKDLEYDYNQTVQYYQQEITRLEEELANVQWEMCLLKKKVEKPDEFLKLMLEQELLLKTINEQKQQLNTQDKLIRELQTNRQLQNQGNKNDINSQNNNKNKISNQDTNLVMYFDSLNKQIVEMNDQTIHDMQSKNKSLLHEEINLIQTNFKEIQKKEVLAINFLLQNSQNEWSQMKVQCQNAEEEIKALKIQLRREAELSRQQQETIKEQGMGDQAIEQELQELRDLTQEQGNQIDILLNQNVNFSTLYTESQNELVLVKTLMAEQTKIMDSLHQKQQDSLNYNQSQQEQVDQVNQVNQVNQVHQQQSQIANLQNNLQELHQQLESKSDENRHLNTFLLERIAQVEQLEKTVKDITQESQAKDAAYLQLKEANNEAEALLKQHQVLNSQIAQKNDSLVLSQDLAKRENDYLRIEVARLTDVIQEKINTIIRLKNGQSLSELYYPKTFSTKASNLSPQKELYNNNYGNVLGMSSPNTKQQQQQQLQQLVNNSSNVMPIVTSQSIVKGSNLKEQTDLDKQIDNWKMKYSQLGGTQELKGSRLVDIKKELAD